MNFIKDDDLAGEGETANEEMFDGDHALEGLVNGADAVGREQCLLGGSEPRTGVPRCVCRFSTLRCLARVCRIDAEIEVIFEPRVAVGKAE